MSLKFPNYSQYFTRANKTMQSTKLFIIVVTPANPA